MKSKLQVLDQEIATHTKNGIEYICITDIARYKNSDRTDDLIRNWLRNRNTIEFLGLWEQLNNPSFKPVEFDGFKKEAGLNSFTLTPKLNELAIRQMKILTQYNINKRLNVKE